ncbi:uncharacterized protein LOC124411382 [Diprion similis]|uniref:uncharacterized protein LOC124411382 n=1 Tax=Diprion similis TaxID=362088 RepID=UPI001EF9A606|nr:uncharacterized protein LOC124411382 [Diprion similis]
MPGKLAPDEVFSREKQFKIDYFNVLDTLLSQMQWCFDKMTEVNDDFCFLTGSALESWSVIELKKHAMDLGLLYAKNIKPTEFVGEVESFKFMVASVFPNLKKATPLQLLNGIRDFSLTSAYPNIEIAYRIFLTITVTTASCGRSFSKLKLIKTYLRSTMRQERLSGLAILSIENSLAKTLDYDEIIDKFASRKARRIADL